MLDIWDAYVQMLNKHNENWNEIWEIKKVDIFSSKSKTKMIQLEKREFA